MTSSELHRDMGRSHFLDLNDGTGRMQLFVSAKELVPENLELFKLLDRHPDLRGSGTHQDPSQGG